MWNKETALFLIFDAENPGEAYGNFNNLIDKIKEIFHSREKTGQGQYIFEMKTWSKVIIIPLVQGKSLNSLAWRLDLLTLLYKDNSEELGWWNHVQQPIPSDVLEQLNIPIWNNLDITLDSELLASISQQLMFMLHLLNIQQIEDDMVLDLQGQNQIEEYYRGLFVMFTEYLSKTQGLFQKIASKLSKSDNEELKDSFLIASDISKQVVEYVSSVADKDGVLYDKQDIYKFVESSQGLIFVFFLQWISYIIGHQ